jgi:hypothetical protein
VEAGASCLVLLFCKQKVPCKEECLGSGRGIDLDVRNVVEAVRMSDEVSLCRVFEVFHTSCIGE